MFLPSLDLKLGKAAALSCSQAVLQSSDSLCSHRRDKSEVSADSKSELAQPQPDAQSKGLTAPPVKSLWQKVQLTLPQCQLPGWLSHDSPGQHAADVQIHVRQISQPAPAGSHQQTSAILHASSHTSMHDRSSLGHQAQQSVHAVADQISQRAKAQSLPWPKMCLTRRSALRWQVEWHGFTWPVKQHAALEVQLDQCY